MNGKELPFPARLMWLKGDAYHATQTFGDCLLLLDRYFLTIPALKALDTLNHSGTVRLEIVTKEKKSCTAFEKPVLKK